MSAAQITEQFAESFDTIEGKLRALHTELGSISSKKPDGPVSKFKITLINEILVEANQLLGAAGVPFKGFSIFDADSLPTASDCVMVLAQYLNSMSKFRFDNTDSSGGVWYWMDGTNCVRKTVRSNYETHLRNL